MSGHRASGRRRANHEEHEEHENEERWLISYADMVTLLMCLFMVLFAISSVNTSKWEALSKSLNEAFSGQILSGGKSIQQTGATEHTERSSPEPPLPAIQPLTKPESSTAGTNTKQSAAEKAAAAKREQDDFKQLKERVDALAAARGLKGQLETKIERRGLVIRLLTDKVLFVSGSADLAPAAETILRPLARMLAAEVRHPIGVEGNTDDRPIRSARFPDNWELSTARATQVVRSFIGDGVNPSRLQASGVAAEHPIASNESDAGRARNRRVEIVLQRMNGATGAGSTGP